MKALMFFGAAIMAGALFTLPVPSTAWASECLLAEAPSGGTSVDSESPPVSVKSLEVTIEEAVLMALENNKAVRMERLNPKIYKTFEERELAVFEPVVEADASILREKLEDSFGSESLNKEGGAGAAFSKYFPTGTSAQAEVTLEKSNPSDAPEQYAARAGISVTQALLKGRGRAANLARLRQARLDTSMSEYEFRGFAESLVAEVETTYWDLVLARRRVSIVEGSLSLARQQLDETRHRIRVGDLAETELAAAEAELALRRENLINAISRNESLQVRLLRLVRPQALASGHSGIKAVSEPGVSEAPGEALLHHVALALKLRPDLNQARLLIQKGDLEIVKTKNGLLPRMDLFISLGRTGYAASFGNSLNDMGSGGYDAAAGFRLEYPVANRHARAEHRRALLTREQRDEALENLRDLTRQDVELAFIELRRARQQVDATAVTRRFQEEKLRAETAKFRVGKSTALLVAQAQRDLLASQVAKVEAVINHLTARTNLHLLEGSLLERRGVASPGSEMLFLE